jgi:hypothetical protein
MPRNTDKNLEKWQATYLRFCKKMEGVGFPNWTPKQKKVHENLFEYANEMFMTIYPQYRFPKS